MQNYATLLQTPDLPEEKRIEYGRAIADASRRLSELITNILRLNKLENQMIFPDAVSYNLGEQLRECVLSVEELWEQKQLELDIDIDDVMLEADEELLTLVWNNLISNAIKFTQPGGTIGVTVKENEYWAIVTVRDTGCGMTAETGRHIFEKFYQGDSSHSSQGNGLGLALVKRVIDIMNGEISVESAPGVGSVFTVRLPK
jgi:signal transduction histidine kinase